jgi:protocatechuate 3,4-dioxygenase beta subunit
MSDEGSVRLFLRRMSRRDALARLGVGIVATPIVGCSTMQLAAIDGGDLADAGALADAAATDAAALVDAGVAWATGGTAVMSGNYANPFAGDVPTTCTGTCEMTLGPCHASSPERQDISEGYPGLPVRLALRVYDEACAPVSGAKVEIWHTRNSGLYSGTDDTGEFNVAFCTGGDADAQAHHYFRGIQTTDAEGVVQFDTCFPGWYSSRTIHIHLKVMIGTDQYLVSQIFFPEDVITEIFSSHPDYSSFGQPDTSNTSDSVLPAASANDYLVSTARQSDGAMLAWRTIFIRRALTDSVCSVAGSGGGMPGGPPGRDAG